MGKTSLQGTGERFRKIADELFDGNKSELARSLDMKPSSFAKYTDGSRRPGSGVLERLSRLGVNINWFLSGKGAMLAEDRSGGALEIVEWDRGPPPEGRSSPDSPEDRFVRIPIVRVETNDEGSRRLKDRKGVACLSETFIDQRYGVDPEGLREFRVSGNAMSETIRPGDRLVVDIGDDASVVDGEIRLIAISTGILVRRVHLIEEGVVLVADNETVSDQQVSGEHWGESYRPLARVLEVVRAV